jgi:predicted DNA-binding protein
MTQKSIKVKPKKRGRPATGKDPLIGFRLPKEMIEAIDRFARKEGTSRSRALRILIERGLANR